MSSSNHYSRTRVVFFASICAALVAFISLSPRWQSTSAKKAARSASNGFAANQPAPAKGVITPAAGNTITVNSTSDAANGTDGLCTLREAITAANNNTSSGATGGECVAGSSSDSDTIDLSGLTSTITLTSVLPTISSNVTINGPGSSVLTVLRNSGNFPGVTIGPSATVSISGLALQGNAPPAGPTSNTGINNDGNLNLSDSLVSAFGQGIRNSVKTLTISNSVISGNTNGGGISNFEGTSNVINTLVSGNNGGSGPGIYNSSGTLNVTNSIVTGSSGSLAIWNGFDGRATLVNSTVSNNIHGGIINYGNLSMTGGLITGNSNGGLIAGGTAVLNV